MDLLWPHAVESSQGSAAFFCTHRNPGIGVEPTLPVARRACHNTSPDCGLFHVHQWWTLSTSPARARTAAHHATDDRSAATRDALEQAGFGETRNQNQGDGQCDAFHLGGSVLDWFSRVRESM